MSTSRRTTPRRGTTLGDSDADRWLRGKPCGAFEFRGEAFLEQLWREHGEDVVEEHIRDNPGTRPALWWKYSAPRSPRGTYPRRYYDGMLPEPRKRLGGIGTPQHEVLNVVPSFAFAIPVAWVDQWMVDYYTGVAVDVNGNLINTNPSGTFKGVAIDDDDPPMYESQATYLKRHGLLLNGEAKRLTKADFDPVYIVDDEEED